MYTLIRLERRGCGRLYKSLVLNAFYYSNGRQNVHSNDADNIKFCPYEILGIGPNSTQKEIRNAYLSKVMIYHPDAAAASNTLKAKAAAEHSKKMFFKIQSAYEILNCPIKKSNWDAANRKPPSSQRCNQFYYNPQYYPPQRHTNTHNEYPFSSSYIYQRDFSETFNKGVPDDSSSEYINDFYSSPNRKEVNFVNLCLLVALISVASGYYMNRRIALIRKRISSLHKPSTTSLHRPSKPSHV